MPPTQRNDSSTNRPAGGRLGVLTVALTLLTIAFLPAVSVADHVHPDTLGVDDDGEDCPLADYSDIQSALDDAQAGDEVVVCDGTYSGSGAGPVASVATSDISLVGIDSPKIVADGIGIQVSASGVSVEGFSVSSSASANASALILVQDTSDVLVTQNVVSGSAGDGIQVDNGTNVRILRNRVAGSADAGIHVTGGTSDSGAVINVVLGSGSDGILVDASSHGNAIEDNVIAGSASGFDAHDLSVGADTAGTANHWARNRCVRGNPAALCAGSSLI